MAGRCQVLNLLALPLLYWYKCTNTDAEREVPVCGAVDLEILAHPLAANTSELGNLFASASVGR